MVGFCFFKANTMMKIFRIFVIIISLIGEIIASVIVKQ